tara:strand:- start:386 stop:760 length:375 start_codon:yes stop_codon:yes gene_type:complete
MIITGATREELETALVGVNAQYGDNVTWNNLEALSATRHRVTLRVHSSSGPGHRLGQNVHPATGNRRRMTAACWHVHGTFFDSLPVGTVIRAGGKAISPGDPWEDRNIGSMMYPLLYSEACDCA